MNAADSVLASEMYHSLTLEQKIAFLKSQIGEKRALTQGERNKLRDALSIFYRNELSEPGGRFSDARTQAAMHAVLYEEGRSPWEWTVGGTQYPQQRKRAKRSKSRTRRKSRRRK